MLKRYKNDYKIPHLPFFVGNGAFKNQKVKIKK
jgi:hypothetical protein